MCRARVARYTGLDVVKPGDSVPASYPQGYEEDPRDLSCKYLGDKTTTHLLEIQGTESRQEFPSLVIDPLSESCRTSRHDVYHELRT